MRSALTWLRVVLPHENMAQGVLFLYGINLLGNWMWGGPLAGGFQQVSSARYFLQAVFADVDRFNGTLLLIAAAAYGAYRAWAFHPLFRGEYRRWLEGSPWTSRLPLPNGPIHLVAQDGLILLVLGGLAQVFHQELGGAASVILTFALVYLSVLAVALALLRHKWLALAAAVGLGLIVRLWSAETARWWALLAAAVVYGLVWLGTRRALAEFSQWGETWIERYILPAFNPAARNAQAPERQPLGWPFDALRPSPEFPGIGMVDAVALSLLVGWWIHVFIGVIRRGDPSDPPLPVFAMFIALTGAAARLILYCQGTAPPLSLAGRMVRLRPILPGYDVILAAPLLAIGWLYLCAKAMLALRLDWDVADPLAAFGALLILLACGPGLRRWRLTGDYRITRSNLANASLEIRPLP